MITRKDQDETDVRAAHGNAGHRERAAFKEWSEGRYEDLAESMPQIVWTADGAGNVTYHNKRWSDLVAEGEDDSRRAGAHAEVDGRAPPRRRRSYPPAVTPSSKAFQFATIAHPNDLASFALGWSTAVKAGVEWEAELRLGSPSVGYRFHLVRAVPRTDGNGNVLAWVGTATDIDARVRADRALRMLADASKILNRSLGNGADAARTLAIIDVEMVLRSALPIFGDGAVLHLRGSELGTSKGAPTLGLDGGQRVQVTGVALDAGVLADPRFELGPATVACTGRAEVHLDVERESSQLSSSFEGRVEEHLRFLDEVGVSAYICVPLVSRDRSLGALTFMRCGVGERYEDADVEVAADLAGRIAVAIDNTWLLRMSERRREELELANESKDVFLATLSHELRTPLNAIVGWTDMMRTGALAPHELARAIETIDRNAHSLSGLVGDLLDVSRIVTGTLKLESKPVSLVSVIESAIVAARPQCASKDITLELTIKKVASVLGDPLRLRQVVNNLLSNAIKFTPPGGRISVRLQTADERVVRVVVSDTGEGIASDFLPHVFERFRQEHSNHRGSTATGMARLPRSMQAGLGLGLAIVKHLVEEHGGKVSATSDGRGKGASFTIELPALDGAAAREEVEDRASLPSVGEPDLSGVHVLIVEDDPDGNELICTILERYGARVTATTSAAAALDALDVERPQVLVSDIGLPDMDGMDLIRAIRKRAEDGAIPAIALTAYASRQDATKALAAGFDAHVAKPVQPSTLGVVIVRLLARSGAALGEPGASRGAAARASCQ